jgi:hypothetical protein
MRGDRLRVVGLLALAGLVLSPATASAQSAEKGKTAYVKAQDYKSIPLLNP